MPSRCEAKVKKGWVPYMTYRVPVPYKPPSNKLKTSTVQRLAFDMVIISSAMQRIGIGIGKEEGDGSAQASVAATSSFSKVSGSHKTKASFQEVKGSPVELVSSLPIRILNTDKFANREIMGKDDSHDIAVMDSPRRCSDGEDDGASDRSGTARKDKSFTMACRSDFQNKGVNHMLDNKPTGQTASHCTNGGVDIVAQDGTHLSAEQIQHHDMKIQGVKHYPLEQGREAVKGNSQVQPAPEMEPRRGRFTAARREFLTAENGTATRTEGNPQVQPAPEMEPRRGRFTATRREFLTAENGTATRTEGNPQVQPAPEMEPRRGRFTAARWEFLTAENGTATRTDRESGREVTEAPHRADRGGWGTQRLCDLGLGFEDD
ncbi:hypothetical protein SESBI_23552 [Sesbania bispinosa]|nr:hypothetical protein SESBI_23552 [Sesbania bispinosa]